jgi:lipoic acid synthetase
MQELLRGLKLHTVCEEAACPNISECFKKQTAAFMILGRNCTRSCGFCNIGHGEPSPVDNTEAGHVAEAVFRLGLRHVVITSVTRDDLKDGGARQFAETVLAVRKTCGNVTIEVLIPDLNAERAPVKTVVDSAPDIINHNLETVPRLYPEVRPDADYNRSLNVLKIVKELSGSSIYTKSGIMVGLGEREDEVLELFQDLRRVGCDFLSIGQYLAPSKNHYPVKEYIRAELFDYYKQKGEEAGFRFVASAAYVRSSYMAEEYISRERL